MGLCGGCVDVPRDGAGMTGAFKPAAARGAGRGVDSAAHWAPSDSRGLVGTGSSGS